MVIPCYYSEKSIREVVELTLAEFDAEDGYECEFVLVNDGSTDGTFEQIRTLADEYPCVIGVDLMRNFGQHNALMAGLHYATGDAVLGMDDDLQTHPSQIFKLVHKLEEGYDLVYGVYQQRKNSKIKNFTSLLNKVSSRILLGRPKEVVSSNFWIITRAVAEEVIKYEAFDPYIDAIFYRVTHNIGEVTIEHFKREHGSSGYTLRKLVSLWLRYWSFSLVPLRVSSVMGVLFFFVGVIAAVVVAVNKLLDPTVLVGWSSTLCVILVCFGLVFLLLGIIGEYLGRIVLVLNNTPQYIVRSAVNSKLPASEKIARIVRESAAAGKGDKAEEGAASGKGEPS